MSRKINIAIIVAGGSSTRFGGTIPKQFVKINKMEVIEYCVETFASIEEIAHIIVICHKNFINHAQELFKNKKKISIICGGNTRFESSFNGLEYIRQNYSTNSNVLIHDAARPFISKEIILKCIKKLNENSGVIVAMPAIETISIVKNGIIDEIPERQNIFMHQTPQCFWFEEIYASYKKVLSQKTQDYSKLTDDCAVFIKNFGKPCVVIGSLQNKKITTKEDLSEMKKFLK
jgi:2-C-methyl-D-erythritol 4-phosphate cytidylyltransferase